MKKIKKEDLNQEIFDLNVALAKSTGGAESTELNSRLDGKKFMVLGEGAVFLILLIILIF